MHRKGVRLIISIITGIVFTVLWSIGTDLLMVKLGVFPSLESDAMSYNSSLLSIAFIYRSIYGIVGAYIGSVIAREQYMRSVLISGGLGFVVSLMGLVLTWGKSVAWYPIMLTLTAMPFAYIGGKIYAVMQQRNKMM